MIYIQRLGKSEKLKTIKECDSAGEAKTALKKLRQRQDAIYYTSQKPCKGWRNNHD